MSLLRKFVGMLLFIFFFSFHSSISVATVGQLNQQFGAEIKQQSDYLTFEHGQDIYHQEVLIKNTGDEVWEPNIHNLSYHLYDTNDDMIIFDGVRTVLPRQVLPGETIEMQAVFELPVPNGLYTVVWDMVKEGATWFGELDTNALAVTTVHLNKTLDFSIVKKKSELYAFSDKTISTRIVIKNEGSKAWKSEEHINLSYHIADNSGNRVIYDGLRTELPKEVNPGEFITLHAKIKLPDKPDSYLIAWDMVQENVSWFNADTAVTKIKVISSIWQYVLSAFAVVMFSIIVYIANKRTNIFRSRLFEKLTSYLFVRLDLIFFFVAVYYKTVIITANISLTNNETKNYIFMVTLMMCILFNFIHTNKLRLIVLFSVDIFISFILFGNLVYYSYFKDVLSLNLLSMANQLSSVSDSVYNLIKPSYYWLFADLAVFVIIFIVHRLKKLDMNWISPKINRGISFALLTVIFIPFMTNIKDLATGDFYLKRYYNMGIVQELGLVNYHLYDAYSFVSNKFDRISANDLKTIQNWKDSKEHPVGDGDYFGLGKNMNVVLIQSEALHDFTIGLKYREQEVTPNLNKFISESYYFTNFFNQTSQGRTSDAEFTTLTSLYPLQSGSVYTTYPAHKYKSLPVILSGRGYYTFSAHGYRGDFWNRNQVHKAMGFRESFFAKDFEMDDIVGMGISDNSFFKQSLSRIDQLPQPFFSFLITLTNHHPYNYQVPGEKFDVGVWEGTFLGDYLKSVHFADANLGKFLDSLKQKSYYDNTIIVIYGDHDSGVSLEDIKAIDDRVTGNARTNKVPLIIYIPGENSETFSKVAGHLDTLPTLLHLLGINNEQSLFMGKNLFSFDKSPVVFRNGSFISEDIIYMDGTCYRDDLEVNSELCEPTIDKVNEGLWISDQIVKFNLSEKLK
ncbi:LTA synthase family protein [Paenibacillus sp. NPDC058071]|uniref:LTA synthase family protein n=1 Tax=Paenibacillus sp. NPDC058071 TaxID=3346326 RepID=UPI0036DBD4A9